MSRTGFITLAVVAMLVLSGCAGWGTDGPANADENDSTDNNSNTTDDLEQADNESDETGENDSEANASDEQASQSDGDDASEDSSSDADVATSGTSDDDATDDEESTDQSHEDIGEADEDDSKADDSDGGDEMTDTDDADDTDDDNTAGSDDDATSNDGTDDEGDTEDGTEDNAGGEDGGEGEDEDEDEGEDVEMIAVTVQPMDSHTGTHGPFDEVTVEVLDDGVDVTETVSVGEEAELPAGDHDIEVRAPGYESATLEDYTIEEGRSGWIEPTLNKQYDDYDVTIEVVDENGSPVDSGEVVLDKRHPHPYHPDEERPRSPIDNGEATLTVQEGSVEFDVLADGYETGNAGTDVREDWTETIELEPESDRETTGNESETDPDEGDEGADGEDDEDGEDGDAPETNSTSPDAKNATE